MSNPDGNGHVRSSEEERVSTEAEGLARKLSLLMDVATAEGHTPSFREIAGALAKQDVQLSRARWSYMVAGTGPVVKDQRLLRAISEFFGVDGRFLTGELGSGLPERIEAQLDLVRAMRAARVRNFAARALGDVSPATLKAITQFLDEEIAGKS